MSDRRPRAKLLWLVVPATGVCAWAGWSGYLTPSICELGADSVPEDPGAGAALADARRREKHCDGHSMECRFDITSLEGGGIAVTVEHGPVDFWSRRCNFAPDDETHYLYSRNGVPAGSASSPN